MRVAPAPSEGRTVASLRAMIEDFLRDLDRKRRHPKDPDES